MQHKQWSAVVMAFVVAALVVGMALVASAALYARERPARAILVTAADWPDLVQEVASSTFRAAPSPLSRW
ncbi:hypothetical protein SLNSH_08715 [Alsobacter soli]|uniref:Uncharacterized protein n=1 Tax=Alsobacter soli TaxID=2109933 RepID=A0A2T1HUE4_9HYPH|nr:hypothetical protein [Alsobacter soli]PSC05286.1 hypothetical protein SLNSH_08715 [Alsobacter soli]